METHTNTPSPWKMYPLGILFGLGFDTSSEIALLGISSIQAARGTSIWLILLFPLLFTAAMCLLDTADGALMMGLYTSTALARDRVAILYYSIVLTVVTVIVALVIGVVQLLSLVLNVAEPTGRFWDGVEKAGDSYEIIGEFLSLFFLSVPPFFFLQSFACFPLFPFTFMLMHQPPGGAICGSFIVFGGLSILLYKPWRRWIDEKRERNQPLPSSAQETDGSEPSESPRHTPYGTVEITDEEALAQPGRRMPPQSKGDGQHASAQEVGERA